MNEPGDDHEALTEWGGPEPPPLAQAIGDVMPSLPLVVQAFIAPADPQAVADAVEALVAEMKAVGLTPPFPVNHFFCGRMYAREILIPAGAFAIGEIQKERHISILSRGEISMLNARGGHTRIRAPYTFVSEPGVRKCGFAHEDTVWTTVHDIGESGLLDAPVAPIEELEDFLVARTPGEYLLHLQSAPKIEAPE